MATRRWLDVFSWSSMVGGLCVYLTFELFRLAGIEMRPDGKHSALTNWKSLILIASIASVFNSIGKQIFFGSLAPLTDEIISIAMFWIGDTLGRLRVYFYLSVSEDGFSSNCI